nr:hypothetical protein 10 [Desulfobulbaceae bacterium]
MKMQDQLHPTQEDSPEVTITADETDKTHAGIAEEYASRYLPDRSKVVGCEGQLWQYSDASGLFEVLNTDTVALDIGKRFSGSLCRRGSDYQAIAKLIYIELLDLEFFDKAPIGAPCKSSFFMVESGNLAEVDYGPELRQRSKLQFDPRCDDFPIFEKFINDSFDGTHKVEQIILLQEVLGALVTCSWHKLQKAVLLYGLGSNGKSVLLNILQDFFPRDLRAAVDPSDFRNASMNCHLAGKVVNIVGELEATVALSARFKDIVACDTPISSRAPYGQPFTFMPRAAHIFSSNEFPVTRDHTHGFYRRWLLFNFPNRVADKDKNPELSKQIVAQEGDQVLAWALDGVKRLVANDFMHSRSRAHRELEDQWKKHRDSVYSFLHDEDYVELGPDHREKRTKWYAEYRRFCQECGLSSVGKKNFYLRTEPTLSYRKSDGDHYLIGGRIKSGHSKWSN